MTGCAQGAEAFAPAVFAGEFLFEYVFLFRCCCFPFLPFCVLFLKFEYPCRKNNDQEPTDQSGQTEKRKSHGGNKGFKTYPQKTKKARREELQEVCNDSNVERKRNPKDKLKTKVEETHGQMDGPKAWGANDFFFDPATFSSCTFLSNPFILDFKKMRQTL